jgi:hypothetical protein
MNATYDPLYLFIDGEWIAANERETAAVINPANERELGRVPLAAIHSPISNAHWPLRRELSTCGVTRCPPNAPASSSAPPI